MDNTSPVALLRVALAEDVEADTLAWYAFDDGHVLKAQGKSPLDELPAHKTLHWILPASVTTGHLLAVPASLKRQQQASIVEQLLEDAMLCQKDDAHVVMAHVRPGGLLVWVCSRAWFSKQLEKWRGVSLQPDAAYPIYDLLPSSEEPTAAHTAGGIVFRTERGQPGFAEDAALLEELIAPATILMGDVLSRPIAADATNLLSGPFTPTRSAPLSLKQFRRSAYLASALTITMILSLLVHWQRLESREKSLKNEIRQTFAAAFPGTPVLDPYLQWKSLVRAKSQSATNRDALDNLARLASLLGDIHPRSAELRNGVARLVVTEAELPAARARLEGGGTAFDVSPAEAGFSRLDFRVQSAVLGEAR